MKIIYQKKSITRGAKIVVQVCVYLVLYLLHDSCARSSAPTLNHIPSSLYKHFIEVFCIIKVSSKMRCSLCNDSTTSQYRLIRHHNVFCLVVRRCLVTKIVLCSSSFKLFSSPNLFFLVQDQCQL